MKSRTSFFNPGVLKKDIFRFSPLWGIYTVCMLLYLLLNITATDAAAIAGSAGSRMRSMAIINCIYGSLSAILLFRDLYTGRLCNALHAMPLRREGWFFTHFTAGMLFCIVPNFLGALIISVHLGTFYYLAWLWLAVMILEYLCFFGIGVFSTQIAGTSFGAVVTGLILNYLLALVSWLFVSFFGTALYGIDTSAVTEIISQYCPVDYLSSCKFVQTDYVYQCSAVFQGFIPGDWIYLAVAAVFGVLFLGGSLLLYRKRQLETAGDFLAVRAAKPVFLLLYTLYVGALFFLMADLSAPGIQYLLLFFGFGVGLFTGWMLLEKRLKVFTRKRFLVWGGFVVAFILSIGLVVLDPLGITRYVPEPSKVASVTISPYNYYYNSKANITRTLTNPEDIQTISDIHRQLLTDRIKADDTYDYFDENLGTLHLEYTLKNGSTVRRTYYLKLDSEAGETLKDFYSHPQVLFGTEDIKPLLKQADNIVFDSHRDLPSIAITYPGAYVDLPYGSNDSYVEICAEGNFSADPRILGLFEAIEKDCLEGNMAQIWEYHKGYVEVGYLSVSADDTAYTTTYRDITIFEDCEHTVAYLKTLAETYADQQKPTNP